MIVHDCLKDTVIELLLW